MTKEFDYTYLSLGGGLQSGCIAEMIVEGALPRIDAAYFADTGDEPEDVYTYIDYLRGRLLTVDVPLITVRVGDLFADLMGTNGRFASVPVFVKNEDGTIGRMKRHCTRDYKIDPILAAVRRVLLKRGQAHVRKNGVVAVNRGVRAACWLGITLDEAERVTPSRLNWVESQWPLLLGYGMRMYRHDCRLWLERAGLPVPMKSSCRRCPYHDDSYFAAMNEADFADVVAFDAALRQGSSRFVTTADGELYLHRSCIPISEVDLTATAVPGQSSLFDGCDSGHCFV